MGLFAYSRRPAKNDPGGRVLEFPFPSPRPRPPQKKTIHNLTKTPPHQDPSYPCVGPGTDSMGIPHPRNISSDLRR